MRRPSLTNQSQKQSNRQTKKEEQNEVSAEQLRELKMMFDYFDTDQSGALDTEELNKLIQMITGCQATEEEKLDILAEVDQDGNGIIQYEEFQALFKKKLMKTNFRKEMELAFKLIDIAESSYISFEELERICLQLNMNFTTEQIQLMMQKGSEADPGPGKTREKGKVYFEQFVQMMNEDQ